jgi:glyoxylase-like metal-dependent hydrolase (beta-lactamase superfamily II)
VKIGEYEIHTIETGRFALDGGAMFGVVPKNLWQKTNPADENNRIDLALRSLLIKGENRNILIDTGIGNKFDAKFASIYKINIEKYSLEKSLQIHQITKNDITDVIITHLHFDHAGGTTYQTGHNLTITFPNAVHYVQAEQWDWATHPSEKDRASFLDDDFKILESSGNLKKLSGPAELFPGIEILVMYGHTPGMQLVKISDNEATLLFAADLIPTASHISIPWVMAYDNHPITTINEKKRLLPLITEQNWIVFFEHDPYRPAATVMKTEKRYQMKDEIGL